ncbi:unnamed protein product [Vicia faba]|uniref:Uncharacterized protein n=1 Tax=Vicia faba TaxID=3906 RepID=A0AAV1AND3_VICFA|nr:unnamed protein product [Vicia faba]
MITAPMLKRDKGISAIEDVIGSIPSLPNQYCASAPVLRSRFFDYHHQRRIQSRSHSDGISNEPTKPRNPETNNSDVVAALVAKKMMMIESVVKLMKMLDTVESLFYGLRLCIKLNRASSLFGELFWAISWWKF